MISTVIVNYNHNHSSIRHTDSKVFYELSTAKKFIEKLNGSGFVAVLHCNKRSDKEYSRKVVKYFFGDYSPCIMDENIMLKIQHDFNIKKVIKL